MAATEIVDQSLKSFFKKEQEAVTFVKRSKGSRSRRRCITLQFEMAERAPFRP
jgi:hypothetical protein